VGLTSTRCRGALQPLFAHQQRQVVVGVIRHSVRRVVELAHLFHQLLMLPRGKVGQFTEFGRDGAVRILHDEVFRLHLEALAFECACGRAYLLLGGGEFEVRLRDFKVRLVALHACLARELLLVTLREVAEASEVRTDALLQARRFEPGRLQRVQVALNSRRALLEQQLVVLERAVEGELQAGGELLAHQSALALPVALSVRRLGL
jgi:hypothetical protein